jgi:hypothetical protein
VLLSFLAAHARLGLTFPVPWPDEASFLWQAIAVQRDTTLFAPQLRPDRHVLWMPPAYMWVAGLLFKITGFSLETARWLSAACVAAGAAALAGLFARLRHPLPALLLLAAFVHAPVTALVGNLARMEALLFALACAALLLVQRRAPFAALACAALLPLVHPIGAFFAAGTALAAGVALWRDPDLRRPRPLEWALLALAAAAWAAYAVYVARHWPTFRADMAFQLESKSQRSVGGPLRGRLLNPALVLPALLAAAAGAAALRARLESALLLAYAAPLAVLTFFVRGFPYDLYPALLLLLASVLVLDTTAPAVARRVAGPHLRAAVPWLLAAGLAVAAHAAFRFAPVYRFNVATASAAGARASGVAYAPPEDRAAVAGYLEDLAARTDRPLTAVFIPVGDSLLFEDLDRPGLRLIFPILRVEDADVLVVHESRHYPDWLTKEHRIWAALWQNVRLPLEEWPLLHERSTTERWRVYRRPAPPAARPAPPPARPTPP